jgi:hypothetical protein
LQFQAADELVKNADENWLTAPRGFPEVTAAQRPRNRDDSRGSPTEWTLAGWAGNG